MSCHRTRRLGSLSIWIRTSTVVVLCSIASLASGLKGSVQVGGQDIAEEQIGDALSLCQRHEPSLTARQCLGEFFLPRWLLDREAAEVRLGEEAQMRAFHADLLHRVLIKHLRVKNAEIADAQVNEYLERHQRDFEKPLRLRLFRILFKTKGEAEKILATLTKDTSMEHFRKLARSKSLDRATHERGGDLGFVWPDGSTDVPQVRVEKSLYEAALTLQDGEISAEIVEEKEAFALLWRRGSKAALPLNDESRRIARLRIIELKQEKETKELLSQLTDKKVQERNDLLLGKLRRKEASLFKEP